MTKSWGQCIRLRQFNVPRMEKPLNKRGMFAILHVPDFCETFLSNAFVRIITAREYNTAYKSRDPSRHIIVQKRISFLYKLQSFTIHVGLVVKCISVYLFAFLSSISYFFSLKSNITNRPMDYVFCMLKWNQARTAQRPRPKSTYHPFWMWNEDLKEVTTIRNMGHMGCH